MTPDDHDRTHHDADGDEPIVIGPGLSRVEARLRDALSSDADSIRPGDRLDAILTEARGGQTLADGTRRRTLHRWLVPGAAAAALAVVAGTIWVAGQPDQAGPVVPPTTTSTAQTATSPGTTTVPTVTGSLSTVTGTGPVVTGTATGTSTAPTSAPAGTFDDVPVYWLAESRGSFALYREFRTVPADGSEIQSAVAAMTRLQPLDPDYLTPWRPASRVAVTQSGSALQVDLSPDAFANTQVGSELAERAVQQLVHTATAAAATAGSPASRVTVTVDGQPYDAWGAVRLGAPISRAPQVDVQAHAWVTAPQEGDVLSAGAVRFTGYGTSFEATFHWELTDSAGTVVAEGNAMGGTGTGGFGELSWTAQLAPGAYVVKLATDDPSGGAEGRGPAVDTKSFTVR